MGKKEILFDTWRFIRFVLILALAIWIGTAASFIFWGEFTFREYSSRLFWAGMGAVILGALAVWASLGSYSTLGTRNIFTAPGDAPIATERIGEQIRMNAGRYKFTLRMASVGIVCMALSAAIEILSR